MCFLLPMCAEENEIYMHMCLALHTKSDFVSVEKTKRELLQRTFKSTEGIQKAEILGML